MVCRRTHVLVFKSLFELRVRYWTFLLALWKRQNLHTLVQAPLHIFDANFDNMNNRGGVVESSWNATLPTDNQIDFTLSFNFGFFKVNLLLFVYVCFREMMWRSKNTMGFIEEEKAKKWSEKSGYVRSWVRMTEANAYRNFLSDEEKKDQELRKMAHIFHGKKFVRPANIHKTHSHSHQTVNQQSHHWFILSQSFHLISNDYGWHGAIAVGRCLWLRHRLHFHVTHQHVTRINGLWAMWQQQQRTANSDRPRNHCRKWCKFRIFPSTIDWLSIQMAQIEIVLRCLSKFQVYLQQQQRCTVSLYSNRNRKC